MALLKQSDVRNRLLQRLAPEDFALVQPFLEHTTTQLHQVLIEANKPVERLYFPEAGFISVTTDNADFKVEVGVIGREGLVGAAPVLLGSDRTPYVNFVQAPGAVLGIGKDALIDATNRSPMLYKLLLRFLHTLLIQTAQTCYVNAMFTIEPRLARWLLMCQDRIGTADMGLTHEFLSMMLGVQRTSVTLALQMLESTELIRARRGRIEIRNRDGLKALADTGYGVPEAEYARLIEDA